MELKGSDGNETVTFSINNGILFACVKGDRFVGSSSSVFHGDNPLHYALPATLCQLFLHIIISRALYFLLRPIRTPKFICNLVSGIILGPSCLGLKDEYWKALLPVRQADVLLVLSVIGSTYFIFLIVLKMDVRMSIKSAKSTWLLGIVPMLANSVVVAFLLTTFYKPRRLNDYNEKGVIPFTVTVMSFSFFPVIAEALEELNLMATELGQIALSSAMFNDIIQWLHIIYLRVEAADSFTHSIYIVVSIIVFLLICVIVIRPVMKLIVRRTPIGKPVNEIYVVLILLGVLVLAAVADALGLSFVVGPIVLGLVIPSGPPLGTTLVDKCEVLMTEFLLPFFFLYIGLNTHLSLIGLKDLLSFQSILLVGDLAKIIACVLIGLIYNIKPKQGVVLGLILSIKGIIELIASSRVKKNELLDDKMFSHLVLFIVEVTAIVTPLIRVLYKHRPRVLNASSILEGRVRNIQGTSRNSEFRVITCIHNEGNVRGIIALLDAFNPASESPICALIIHLIELLGKSSPILLPINYKKNKKFLALNYPKTNPIFHAFENFSNNSSGPVMILPYINVAPYRNMHEAVCNLVQDKLVPLIILPFHENDNLYQDGEVATSISKVNAAFQKHSLCSVGLLVDRHLRLGTTDTRYSFNVGIFFIGGPDDREALALGIRMAEKPNAVISLFRFVLRGKNKLGGTTCSDEDEDYELGDADVEDNKEEEEEEEEEEVVEETNDGEMMLDESLIDEFKTMKYGNGNVSWIEIFVDDEVDMLETIRGLEGNYDLVMVGRRHHTVSFDEEEMGNFIENAKILGIIGDMLSSTEFCIGMVPVLVLQCGGDERESNNNNNLFDRSVGSISGYHFQPSSLVSNHYRY